MEDLRFPIGKFSYDGPSTAQRRQAWIHDIAQLPDALVQAIAGLTEDQLDTPYRPEGWTVTQTVHHLADSHMNSFLRFKLALTEDIPTIKPYSQPLWADLPDGRTAPVASSLALLGGLHDRWVVLLQAMGEADFGRTYQHPESGLMTLDRALALYSWHGLHHTAHITRLRERMGW